MSTPLSALDTIDFKKLENILDKPKNDTDLFKAVVNTPFEEYKVEMALLFLGVIVLLLVNKSTGMIDRIALSKTEVADLTKLRSAKPFEDIKIPVNYSGNIIAKAIESGKPQDTDDWPNMFTPALTAAEARVNQAYGGIAYSAVYPLKARDGGAMIFSYYQYPDEVGPKQHEFMEKYSRLVSKVLVN